MYLFMLHFLLFIRILSNSTISNISSIILSNSTISNISSISNISNISYISNISNITNYLSIIRISIIFNNFNFFWSYVISRSLRIGNFKMIICFPPPTIRKSKGCIYHVRILNFYDFSLYWKYLNCFLIIIILS